MRTKIFAVVAGCFFAGTTYAQDRLEGTVTEAGSNARLAEVFVKNTSNKRLTLTDKNGKYIIPAGTGNILIFSAPGYASDTLFLTDMRNKYISLTPLSIALREVNITASRRFNPRAEYPEVYTRAKVYPLSPTSWFSKDARDARRLKHYFERDAQERTIDSAFNRVYVGSLVPLKGKDLEDFMTIYRPTYAFVRDNNGQSMVTYVNDSYKRWKALPASKRKVPDLQ
ncbi:peptidase associated/transthyretin-like domain-containing protein [Mucilaginibacter ginkgonis]|uniref:Carboxypeptidase-like protein n=1 Tax=Mucilaginibacter ginkgonis TaxID=2682091 RepID=A0A6I4HZC6_9SPHI|nr:hypothetical protein [Mucilaginibacter ginkgonis]QQL48623.1 hypothetical protein GO620_010550 [Mucilaginibacter ginkgonis]